MVTFFMGPTLERITWTELLAGDEALATADLNHSMPDLPGLAGSSRDGQFSIDVL